MAINDTDARRAGAARNRPKVAFPAFWRLSADNPADQNEQGQCWWRIAMSVTSMPDADYLSGDRLYDADLFRDTLET